MNVTDQRGLFHKLLVGDLRPNEIVGAAEAVDDVDYLRRWFVIPHARAREKTWWFFKKGNIFLHHFNRSDDDRALHDHPWRNISVLLWGSYIEHTPGGVKKLRRAGHVVFRKDTQAHRIELLRDNNGKALPVWTLFITGPKTRDWGFHCPKGWKPWWLFVNPNNAGEVGPGCGDN